ncbi:MAG TPA: phage holin family protein [Thermoanaerobaculia bacterium]|nr:phage holin family protein [Thermoanaerobaculia bacterium]
MHMILRILINAVALGIAAYVVPGIHAGGFTSLLLTAVIFGFVNALVRPVLKLLSCPIILLTLGLFTLILNALMLLLTARLGKAFGVDFAVNGFVAAFLGALLVSVVSTVLSWVVIPPATERDDG